MRHVSGQLKDFGSLIWSTNDLNLFNYKETKDAFGSTNKLPDLLHAKLLTKRVTSVIHGYSES